MRALQQPNPDPPLQSVLDSEGMSLELRHVCSFVLSCASHHSYSEILDLCVQLIGFVVFSHPSNQVFYLLLCSYGLVIKYLLTFQRVWALFVLVKSSKLSW